MTQTDAEYRGTLINAFACFTLIVMILFVFGKVATKWKMIRKFQNDDILMILAMVSSQSLVLKSSSCSDTSSNTT